MIDPKSIDWRIYAIIDASGPAPFQLAERVLVAGVGVLQLRDKRGNARDTMALGRKIREICRVPFIVNDRLDIALALDADGVHVGPDDMPVADVVRIAPGLLVGASVGTPDEARAAAAAGAHYLGSGAVFDARASKPDAHHHRGVDALRAVVEAVDLPVVGIGGITEQNAHLVHATGAWGVAVIRALVTADDLAATVASMRA